MGNRFTSGQKRACGLNHVCDSSPQITCEEAPPRTVAWKMLATSFAVAALFGFISGAVATWMFISYVPEDLRHISSSLFAAQGRLDVVALDQLLHQDFQLGEGSGPMIGRKVYLRMVGSGTAPQIAASETQVLRSQVNFQLQGQFAFETGHVIYETTSLRKGATPGDLQTEVGTIEGYYTNMWVKQGAWRLLNQQFLQP